MTGGFDEGYGSASSSPVPTEGPEDERSELTGLDGSADSGADATFGASSHSEIPRSTRPFRAWGAAHERVAPSLWERLVGWMRGVFASKKSDHAAVDAALRAANESGPVAKSIVPSDDDFAASVDEFTSSAVLITPEKEVFAASIDVAAAPADDDFASTDDDRASADHDFASADDFLSSAPAPDVAPAPDADPLWDAPVVAEVSSSAPPSLGAEDFADVWTPPAEVAEEAAPAVAEAPAPEPPKKKGFFARLFSRKEKQQDVITDEHREAAAAWASEVDEIRAEDSSALEPADADFADSPVASAVPAEDDFESESVPAPSLEHSSEDAASLAAFLEATAPAAEEEVVDIASIEETVIVDAAPALEEEPPAAEAPAPVAEVDTAKKPGFFSALLRRVSRSQFAPKLPAEPEPVAPPAAEPEPEPEPIEAIADVSDVADFAEPAALPEVTEVVEVDEVVEASAPVAEEPAAADDDSLFDTLPTHMAAVPRMTAPPVPDTEFQATQPFPAFRDARDDFADEAQRDESARKTETVEVPALDEGEKTDEFQVVPPSGAETAETRQVAGFWGRLFGSKAPQAPAEPVSGEAAATPAPEDDKTPFVLAKFRTFYNEIIRDKHQKSDVISGFATAVIGSAGATDTSDPEFAAQLLSKRLSEMLELQAAESNWTGGDAAKYYPEAQYAMVALADETFATTDWPGRPSWHKYMLEPRMYGTRGADIEFFKRIDKLLKEAPQEKGARDLARLYLMVIASGFRGKFRVPNVRRPLAEYRRRLYEYSHQQDPLALYERDRRILPEAAEHTLASRAVGRFTSAQKWIAAVLILLVLYIGVSHYAWTRLSADLKDIMSRIENTDATGKTP